MEHTSFDIPLNPRIVELQLYQLHFIHDIGNISMTDVECYNITVSKQKKKSEKMLPLYVKTLHKVRYLLCIFVTLQCSSIQYTVNSQLSTCCFGVKVLLCFYHRKIIKTIKQALD